ncbi:MAG: FliI/YscN family ATPase [Deltaproteobacteria bacterium]|nr:FliI/YscN family ATPase [Deltaproteobacteria bacterium]
MPELRARLALAPPGVDGYVTEVLSLSIEARARGATVGDLYKISGRDSSVTAEVVGLRGPRVLMMPYGSVEGIRVGAAAIPLGDASGTAVGDELLGRVVDARMNPLDRGGPFHVREHRPVHGSPLPPLDRGLVDRILPMGLRALDGLVPCGRGQRLGIFAGAGVGKSRLLGALTETSSADVIVLALVGERGREVRDFVERVLGPKGRARSVVVVATSDRPPAERMRAALSATAVAEYFREQGASVLLVVDSLTRFAMAQREVGLSVGEPPTTKGYPASVFAALARLLERAGAARSGGSITGLYSVLVEGDDLSDPVADAARGLLDGHIVLSRSLAGRGHYPAVDVLQSLSRLEGELLRPKDLEAARRVRTWLSKLSEAQDLLSLGAYRAGGDPVLDKALEKRAALDAFLTQDLSIRSTLESTRADLLRVTEVSP